MWESEEKTRKRREEEDKKRKAETERRKKIADEDRLKKERRKLEELNKQKQAKIMKGKRDKLNAENQSLVDNLLNDTVNSKSAIAPQLNRGIGSNFRSSAMGERQKIFVPDGCIIPGLKKEEITFATKKSNGEKTQIMLKPSNNNPFSGNNNRFSSNGGNFDNSSQLRKNLKLW
jgi:hypothetical protein